MAESKLKKACEMSFEEWSTSIDEGMKKDAPKMTKEQLVKGFDDLMEKLNQE